MLFTTYILYAAGAVTTMFTEDGEQVRMAYCEEVAPKVVPVVFVSVTSAVIDRLPAIDASRYFVM